MPTGDALRRQQGFTYIGLLLFVAITGAALAALGQAWTTAVQREKERELEFRGQEIASAIQSYRLASPAQESQPPQYPRRLDDLLVDARGLKPRHHLRRLYPDPLTGKPDWVLIADPANPQAFHGLRSRSEQPLMRRIRPDGTPLMKASEWVFLAQDGAPVAPVQGASATTGKASGIP